MSNFKKIGYDIYTCNTPSFQTPGGACYTIDTQHSKPLSLEDADNPDIVKIYRLETLIRRREMREHVEKKKFVIVMFEKCWSGHVEKSGLNYEAAKDPNGPWYNRVYNSVRGSLVEKTAWEGETTYRLTND